MIATSTCAILALLSSITWPSGSWSKIWLTWSGGPAGLGGRPCWPAPPTRVQLRDHRVEIGAGQSDMIQVIERRAWHAVRHDVQRPAAAQQQPAGAVVKNDAGISHWPSTRV
ncbi:hypothetical protein [Polymorphobacter sp. PAMC 29334]|uniref:hypothetical protein n=1 Tax=Polymorphobacter sp. PAMC 29334 TaxID=2862331 RepID=UPI001CA4B8E6|nr:hypothetical protein [Polymorphobacter sp. PAMC 29334]